MTTVSVIIPTYKRNSLLREAIESAEANRPAVSDIIVVDGSGESYAKPVIKEFEGVTYIAQDQDQGVAAARDAGVKSTDSEWVRFLDDDDLLTEGAIEAQLDCANKTDAGVIYGSIKWPNGHVVRPDPDVRGNVLRPALEFNMAPCVPSTMLVHRDLFDKIGSMADLPSDDHALDIELSQLTEYEYVDQVVSMRNSGGEGLGGTIDVAKRRADTLSYYRDLYDKFSPEVLNTARAQVALRQADSRISEYGWSTQAIYHAAMFFWYERSLVSLGYLFASIFGRPGRDLGKSIITR